MHETENNYKKLDQIENTARYFVEKRQVSWVVLLGVIAWGVFGYFGMPKRKDPEIPVRETLAIARWPGMPADRVEELLTKPAEQALAKNSKVVEIRSITRDGTAYVYAKLDEKVNETARELDDLKMKVDAIQLPPGAEPIDLVKDFGDTATLMLTIASPSVDEADLSLRGQQISSALTPGRTAILWPHARTVAGISLAQNTAHMAQWLEGQGTLTDVRALRGSGFTGFDALTSHSAAEIKTALHHLSEQRLPAAEMQPDVWPAIVVQTAAEVAPDLRGAAGTKYSYRELDHYTEEIEKALKTLPVVGRVSRSGLIQEKVELNYSEDHAGDSQLSPQSLSQALSARSIPSTAGGVNTGARSVSLVADADLQSEKQIAAVLVPSQRPGQPPARLSDLVSIERGYETPAHFMNFHSWRDSQGRWNRSRAITLDVQMRSGEQIDRFSKQVDKELARVTSQLPGDLVIHRTSDQPLQVAENLKLFMGSLGEAVILVVLVSWLGFWEWRSALLMALAIPITLAMTFGMMFLLGVDLQQISVASLIIALGLLVDDPVVAGDAIKREISAGRPRLFAAWQGPTKLARAILFATVTNVVSYLPFLLLKGDNRRFLFTLPVVMTCALIASRLVSMTFIPLLGFYILKGKREPSLEERRSKGFGALYYKLGTWAIAHRWRVLAAAAVLLALSFGAAGTLKQQFFPFERQYLSYIDVWTPQDAPVSATAEATEQAEAVLEDVADQYGRQTHRSGAILKSLSSWIGGGAPRYWLSSNPEPQLPNYGHILIQVADKEDTENLLSLWQQALNERVPGATLDVRRLETSAPVGIPVAIRLSGNNLPVLRDQAAKLKQILHDTGLAARVRDDWGEDALSLHLSIDSDKASLAGLSEKDIANALSGALEGSPVGTLHDGDHSIPIILRQNLAERARLSDLSNLYVYSQAGTAKTPLSDVAHVDYRMQPARIVHYQQFRTITVLSFPSQGHLPSELLMAAVPQIQKLETELPVGVRLEIAGEYKEQMKGFGQLAVVMLISVFSIFLALVIQFHSSVKPLIVFAAIPFGVGGALTGLAIMGQPFGFMAFLGIASLIGVIVSHIIVLFDCIEEKHAEGQPLQQALLDAGILRLRPVLITVGATVMAFVPLALHGGPLWEPLCYAQIAGLTVSTAITLLLVPVVYAVFVLDLKWVKWDKTELATEKAKINVLALRRPPEPQGT